MNDSISFEELKYTLYEIQEIYHRFSLKLGLSDTVYSLFDALLNDQQEFTLTKLSLWLGMPKQTLHSALLSMQQKGLITVQEGKRNKTIRLSEEGKKIAEETVGRVAACEQQIMSQWPEEDRRNFCRLSRKLLNDLDTAEKGFQKTS